jgi:CRISPR-associated protein Cas6
VDDQAVIDVQFGLNGTRVPKDHGLALFDELARLLPWLAQEALAAIHPLHGADGGEGMLLLNRRAKLVIRIPRERLDDLLTLEGKTLTVAGNSLTIGHAKIRALTHHTPLYAQLVTTGSADEGDFARDIMRLLDELDIETRFICGRQQTLTTAQGTVAGFSLMLHGLPVEHAMRVQQLGLGGNRKLGCGVFIPHKSINALV